MSDAIDKIKKELSDKSISLTELIAFKKEIEQAIQILQDDFIQEFREMALANGIGLEFLAGELVKSSIEEVTPNKLPPKYKNPNDVNQTWSGHGKKPKWITEWIDDGNNLDDLLIEKSNS